SPEFRLPGLRLVRGEHYVLGVKYIPKASFEPSSFALVQTWPDRKIVGGETYVVFASDTIRHKSTIAAESSGKYVKEDDMVTIQPNPFRNNVDIIFHSKEDIGEIEVYSASGQLILHLKEIKDSQVTINTSEWMTGQYSVIIQFNNGERIIKNVVKS